MAEQAGLRFCDGGLTPELLVHDTHGLLRAIEIEAESARQLGTDNHLTAALEARFIEGDVELYRGYARDVMAREGGASRQQTLEELGRFLGHRERHPPPTAETVQFDVKQTLYRPLQLSLTLLCGLHDIRDELDSKGRLARLLEGRHLSMAFANLYINALEDVCRLRVESHLHAGREEDAIEMATLDRGKKEGAIRAGQAVAAVWSALEELAARPDRRPGPFLSDRPLAPAWTSDEHGQCQVCHKAIGKGSRHHCRKCGKLVCDACSKTRAALTPTGAKERICDTCAPSVVKVWGAATKTPDAHGQCEVCAKRIGIMMRHHCRKCGKLVCGDCSKGTLQMGSSKIRVCDPCVAGG